jgi:hypothetical protein
MEADTMTASPQELSGATATPAAGGEKGGSASDFAPAARARAPKRRGPAPLRAVPSGDAAADTANADDGPRNQIQRSREVGLALVNGVTVGAERISVIQDRLADATQIPILASVIRAQADLTRGASQACARTSRALLQR